MYLLDTNHCSFIIHQEAEVIHKLNSLPQKSKIYINSIIYGELILMAEKSERKCENLQIIESIVKTFSGILSIDEETSKIYGQFHAEIINHFAPKEKNKRRKYKVQEAGIYPNDLWIASTAIQHDLVIVSQDKDFQQMNKVRLLKLECWIPTVSSDEKV
ncbi:nuclease [Scytonema hofmannii PCC 7110]|uniref:Nuclease n=1 Tax=Scytonema hofmannii PCC 7110 TaxID=128403 RepID=A0A139XHC6_9CYAN|nr:nuclease [Scytonema hofmannii PCC 7110]